MGSNHSSEIAQAISEAEQAKENARKALEALERMEKSQWEADKQRESAEQRANEAGHRQWIADTARDEAERARQTAEQRVHELVQSQLAADNARGQAEAARQAAEQWANQSSQNQLTADSARGEAERGRQAAEQRASELVQRQLVADKARADAELARQAAEHRASQSSQSQLAADNARKEAESARQAAEQRAKESSQGLLAAEKAREEAERARATAEGARTEAERARKEAEERWMAGIPQQHQPSDADKSHFQQLYGIDRAKINIGIVGTSGTGKSSLLNSLRGLTPRNQGAAATGINETTLKVQGYPDPRSPNLVWYDVPGANTPRVKGWSYFVDHGLYSFDVLVVVFSDRFTQTVATLIGNANRCFIPALLVRTKADQLITNYMDDAAEDISLAQALECVAQLTRQKVRADLERSGLQNQRVYIVSKVAMKELVANGHSQNIIDEKEFLDDINQRRDSDDDGKDEWENLV